MSWILKVTSSLTGSEVPVMCRGRVNRSTSTDGLSVSIDHIEPSSSVSHKDVVVVSSSAAASAAAAHYVTSSKPVCTVVTLSCVWVQQL